MSEQLNFRISSALKNIIGRELINDKFIAVFELVKNSYDAGAKRVDIDFLDFYGENPTIVISDNGTGMSYNDLKNKWLFVAYSEKKEKNHDSGYRDRIKRKTAGAKGVGRFSCDRLGAKLSIETSTSVESDINILNVDWDNFEKDDSNEFIDIRVDYEKKKKVNTGYSGTKVTISSLRENWNKSDLLALKKSLCRLINPDFIEGEDDEFNIYINVPDLVEYDLGKNELERINGRISNDVFEKLNIKTTNIFVEISKDGQTISTTLTDRGQYIYRIKEKNPFCALDSIRVKLFYLNKSAKRTFTMSMGIEPTRYGSIFVYKNNFRVYPYGEPGLDVFDIDRRKAQGYNRYLGTRDLLGRISIESDDKHFIETSSRNNGFLATQEFVQLRKFFDEKVFRQLEKYVVDIIKWGDIADEGNADATPLSPKDVFDQVLNRIANISSRGEIIEIDCNQDLIATINEAQKDSLASSVSKLEKLAANKGDEAFSAVVHSLKRSTGELLKEKKATDKLKEKLAKKLESSTTEMLAEKDRSYFLLDALSLEQEDFLKKMHIVKTNVGTVKTEIAYLYNEIETNSATWDDVKSFLRLISHITERISAATSYSGIANFDLENEKILGDLVEFILEYVNKVFANKKNMKIQTLNRASKFITKFCPQDIATVLENIISNSEKANAKNLQFNVHDDNTFLYIDSIDDGNGLNKNISNVNEIFSFAKSYADDGGTGIGMYHIKQIIEDLGGMVSVNLNRKNGFELNMRIKK